MARTTTIPVPAGLPATLADLFSLSGRVDDLGVNVKAYGAVPGIGVSPAVRTANTAAIQQAADVARDQGRTLVIVGTYEIDGTVQFECNVDGATGELRIDDTSINPAVRVGSAQTGPVARLSEKILVLPRIRQTGKSGTGWSGNDLGLDITNCYSCHITIPYIVNFSTNLRLSAYSTGCVYNTLLLGLLENGKVNLQLAPQDSGGWVNENLFLGGRWHMNSNEGTNISGARHILISPAITHPVNNNLFIKPSIEGNGPEYHVDVSGQYNTWFQARWEASPPKVYLNEGSSSNVFEWGYSAHNIVFTRHASGDVRSSWFSRALQFFPGKIVARDGASSGNGTLYVLGAASNIDANPETAYQAQIGANTSKYKNTADTHPRIELAHTLARINFGGGSAAVDTYLRRFGTAGLQTDKKLLAIGGIGVGNSASATTPGTVTRKMEVFDSDGASIGFVALYDGIS